MPYKDKQKQIAYVRKRYHADPTVGERHTLGAALRKRIVNARANLQAHYDESGEFHKDYCAVDKCKIGIIRRSKLDCLERLYEENFIVRHKGVTIPNCSIVLAQKLVPE